ncbi:MAG: hypothetical protein JNK42_06075 [Caedimonas sp.]|nr:hypothetical protein [Caedimonas sp.]
MNKKFGYFLVSGILASIPAHAESVTSGSKHTIIVEVYKGPLKEPAACNPKENDLVSGFKGIIQTYKATEGFDSLKSTLSQGINTALRGSGCDLINKATPLQSGGTLNIPVDAIVVAYKDPVAAWKNGKKLVNPLPAVCKVQAGKTILLETRKSAGLQSLIGVSGDGGLKCTIR